jgi:hypothetical protein
MKIGEHNRIVNEVNGLRDLFIKGRSNPYRVSTKVWKYMLLNEKDRVVIDGAVRRLSAKGMGAGVYEISVSTVGVVR